MCGDAIPDTSLLDSYEAGCGVIGLSAAGSEY
jgi:hypothetical protein